MKVALVTHQTHRITAQPDPKQTESYPGPKEALENVPFSRLARLEEVIEYVRFRDVFRAICRRAADGGTQWVRLS